MKWQLQETRALQVEFSSILPTDGYRLSLFGRGPIALHGLVHFLNTIGPSLTKVIYAYFDRISFLFGLHWRHGQQLAERNAAEAFAHEHPKLRAGQAH